ncbi:MAG: A/G-specific adenine glycosylase, partial [Comamonadaceae bacterium]
RRSSLSLWLLQARRADGAVWLQKRPATGIWAGLYSLPAFDSIDDLLAALRPAMRESALEQPAFLHVLTHKDLHLHPVHVNVNLHAGLATADGPVVPDDAGNAQGRWVPASEWPGLGLPAPVRRLLGEG